jgi:hypothetical protein
MKRKFRIFFGSLILTGSLFITTDSCVKNLIEGNCYIDCICGDCGYSYSDSLTKKECEAQAAEDSANSDCTCGCSYTWEEW